MRAKDVPAAMEALKPSVNRWRQELVRVKPKHRNRRRNVVFVRQGEWFFVPGPGVFVDPLHVRTNEPMRRGGGSKPHMVEELYRTGGQVVYVCGSFPNGVSEAQYKRLLEHDPKARNWGWRQMRADMQVFARGRVSHAAHATIVLRGWHRVLMNTETNAAAAAQVRFLD